MDLPASCKRLTAVICALLLAYVPVAPSEPIYQSKEQPAPEAQATKIPNDQLDSLVAPIALYPDPVLAQVLAASTYPLELIQLQQWLSKNKTLKDKALADAVAKQPWDASVQSMAGLPDVVKRLTDDIQWTTDLGNAFLAQQSDVMDAVQRMRKKAQDKGLKSNEQMKVETQTVENKQVVVIQQANPQVIQVPSYDPVVVYGPPPYPYPPITYPPPPPSGWAVVGGMALSFGIGVAMGAMWSGGWGYNCGWHGGNNNITINNNNNFNRNTNVQGGTRTNVNGGAGGSWQHNPQHRGGTPYSNRATADKFGGTARGDSAANRQANARQRQQGGGNNRASGGAGDRGGVGDNRGGVGDNRGGVGDNRGGGGDRGGAGDNRGASGDRGGNRPSAGTNDVSGSRGGGGDRAGNRSVSSGANSDSKGGAFGGSGGSAGSARASSSRGASSMGGRSGGGRSGGGGGGGGGRRR